ncbi:MAG TPA: hypothetical protein VFK88_09090 [Gallionella sp.]|nr:hypothetical protein [Gallionella sp.]
MAIQEVSKEEVKLVAGGSSMHMAQTRVATALHLSVKQCVASGMSHVAGSQGAAALSVHNSVASSAHHAEVHHAEVHYAVTKHH